MAFVVGGDEKLDVELYTPEGGCNTLLNSVPAPMLEFWRPILAYVDDKILACGGSHENKICWSYDVASNTWSKHTTSMVHHDYMRGYSSILSFTCLWVLILLL